MTKLKTWYYDPELMLLPCELTVCNGSDLEKMYYLLPKADVDALFELAQSFMGRYADMRFKEKELLDAAHALAEAVLKLEGDE